LVGKEGANAIDLRLAPDKVTGLATVALPFVALWGVGVEHWRYASFAGL
jgi:hypothetical protein